MPQEKGPESEEGRSEGDSLRVEGGKSLGRCEECGELYELTFKGKGQLCFECAVHVACSCADEGA
jgi:hypothetical protein